MRPAEEPIAAPRWRGVAGVLVLAVVPWTWFVLRDALGPVTDVVAIMLPPIVVLVTIGAALAARRYRRFWALAASGVMVGVVAVVGPWLPQDAGAVGGRGVVVAGANVDGQSRPATELRAISADVLVVLEPSEGIGEALGGVYPYEVFRRDVLPPVGVFSRYPMHLLEPPGPRLPGARLEIDGPDGPFVLYAMHIPRPWLWTEGGYQATVAEHFELAELVAQRVRAETLPVVLIGDLNSTDRGRDYRALLGEGLLVDATREGVGAPTSVGKWGAFLGRIDHVLVSRGWCGDGPRRVPLPGSSHLGVTVAVGPCASGGTDASV